MDRLSWYPYVYSDLKGTVSPGIHMDIVSIGFLLIILLPSFYMYEGFKSVNTHCVWSVGKEKKNGFTILKSIYHLKKCLTFIIFAGPYSDLMKNICLPNSILCTCFRDSPFKTSQCIVTIVLCSNRTISLTH